ncbi:MAG TPA: enoyl-CoA hydratase-related protein, partial [Thermoanaerobaculia bacterium]
RVASDAAKFAQSFVRIGFHPDWGGTWFLPRAVGRSAAFEMMATGRIVDAAEALRIGLADRVVPAASLNDETQKVALAIASGPPLAIAAIKHALSDSERNELSAQIDLETENQLEAFQSKDAAEGMTAFFEKRLPKFKGE